MQKRLSCLESVLQRASQRGNLEKIFPLTTGEAFSIPTCSRSLPHFQRRPARQKLKCWAGKNRFSTGMSAGPMQAARGQNWCDRARVLARERQRKGLPSGLLVGASAQASSWCRFQTNLFLWPLFGVRHLSCLEEVIFSLSNLCRNHTAAHIQGLVLPFVRSMANPLLPGALPEFALSAAHHHPQASPPPPVVMCRADGASARWQSLAQLGAEGCEVVVK